MRGILAASALAMLLTGCSGVESTDNHGYGYAYDLSSPDGTRLRNLPGSLELSQADFEDLIAEPYRATEKCAQIVTGGPLVVAVIMDETGYATIGRGNTFLDTGLIRATPQSILDSRYYAGNPDTGRLAGTSTLRHEFIHYLLAVSGFPEDLNASHQSPLFKECSGL